MLMKWIFLLQVTLSLKQEKIKELNPVGKSVCSNREKIRRGFEEFSRDNVVINQSLRLRRLFKLLLYNINFYVNKTYDPLTLFTLPLLLLKKLLIMAIFIICKLMGDLLD